MSSRTVVEIHPGDDDDSFMICLNEPSQLPDAARIKRFPYRSSDPVPTAFLNGVGNVDEIGAYLMDALVQHPAVAEALRRSLSPAQVTPQPLLLRISAEAENVPWETVFANKAFLALDKRWPVARMGYQDVAASVERDFQPPLHVMLILAADGVDATAEWEGILASLQAARFPVMVTAIVAQRELRDKIAATNVANVSIGVHMVPTGRGLIDLIRDTEPSPNVLHFFCHGAFSNGRPYLHIGTALSAIDAGRGAVTLFASDIPVDALAERLWLVTLNCCRGAQGLDGAASLVFSLMGAGVPAVAGMRLPVSDTDANVFSNSFYRSLVRLLAPAAEPGKRVELDWTQTLYEARMALCERHRTSPTWAEQAMSSREWTLPVLYVTGKSFALQSRAIRRAAARRDGATKRGEGAAYVQESAAGKESVFEFAPELAAQERTAAETELQILRGLVSLGLGAPPEALQAYQDRIRQLELQLYGAS